MHCKLLILLMFMISAVCFAEEKVVWDGENIGKNSIWKTNASATIKDSVAEIKFTGKGWSGIGLNWEGYTPATAGVQMDNFKSLVILLKKGSDLNGVRLVLIDNKKKKSADIYISKYVDKANSNDEVTRISIPLEVFKGKGNNLENGVIWEVMIHTWSGEEKNTKVLLDRISFSDKK